MAVVEAKLPCRRGVWVLSNFRCIPIFRVSAVAIMGIMVVFILFVIFVVFQAYRYLVITENLTVTDISHKIYQEKK